MATVNDIIKGRGIRDDADDTIRWIALFRQEWSKVAGQTPVTAKRLDKAELDATELLVMLDKMDDERTGSPRDMRRRAYTRWYSSYAEIMSLGRYLLRDDPDVALRFPRIAPERTEAEAKSETEVLEDEAEGKPKVEMEAKGAGDAKALPAMPAQPAVPA